MVNVLEAPTQVLAVGVTVMVPKTTEALSNVVKAAIFPVPAVPKPTLELLDQAYVVPDVELVNEIALALALPQ